MGNFGPDIDLQNQKYPDPKGSGSTIQRPMGIVNVGIFGIYAFAWCLCCKETLGKIVTIICNQVYTQLRVPGT